MPERLPIDKPQALVHCGAGIERGLESFFGAGEAMATIREKRLSKADYKTFEEYGRDKRGMSRVPAHRCMESAHVVAHWLLIGNIPGKEEARQCIGHWVRITCDKLYSLFGIDDRIYRDYAKHTHVGMGVLPGFSGIAYWDAYRPAEFTNNQAERDLRMNKVWVKVS